MKFIIAITRKSITIKEMRLMNRLVVYLFHPKYHLRINSYFFAILTVFIALLFSLLFIRFTEGTLTIIIFVIPVILSSAYGGFKVGIFSTVLGMLVAGFFLIKPYFHLDFFQTQIYLRMLIFFMTGVLISLLSEARNISERELQNAITTEQIAKRDAIQQIRIREHFIAVASHELKSPVTSQKAFLQLLKKEATKNHHKKYLEYIDKILLQTDKITSFIDDLLDISKMQSRKFQYHFSNFDLREAFDDAIDLVQNLLVSHTIKIKGKSHKIIYGDKVRITQVLANLLSNAIKYSPEQKEVIIRIKDNKHFVQVSVQDFGIGIEDEYKEKIFNRFFRISGSDESNFKGFGLGLYLTAKIIKKHKGKIWVESEVGKGSTFIFTLPLKKIQNGIIK